MTAASKIYSPVSLSALKQWKLKNWAFFMGLPTTGSKAELAEAICRRMKNTRPLKRNPLRVVSVDMGIRNLAFCVIDVPSSGQPLEDRKAAVNVKSWIRLDLLNEQSKLNQHAEPDVQESHELDDVAPSTRKVRIKRDSSIVKGAFEPETLAPTAYKVALELLRHKPHVILIERQRHRSGGASAVLEWTVRVNMLESMIWASLMTMRTEDKQGHHNLRDIVQMSPSRVANYWTTVRETSHSVPDDFFADDAQVQRVARTKISKRLQNNKEEKISIVQSWASGQSDMNFTFENDSSQIAEAFQSTRKKAASELAGGKLDDLADCMLQAMTWVRWQENQRRIGKLYESLNTKH